MKTLRYLFLMLMAGVLISGCQKDTSLFEDQKNVELKLVQFTKPFKGNFEAEPHPEIPGRYMVSGNATLAGKVNPEESFYQFTHMEIVEIDGQLFLQLEGWAEIVGANGHGLKATLLSYQTLGFPATFQGKLFVIPGTGTGQFQGCSGTIDSSGEVGPEGLFMTVNGHLVYN